MPYFRAVALYFYGGLLVSAFARRRATVGRLLLLLRRPSRASLNQTVRLIIYVKVRHILRSLYGRKSLFFKAAALRP